MGVDIIILDHHEAPHKSKDAITINNQLCDYPNKQFCGGGVAHSALAIKLGINDEGYLLRHKSNTMEKILEYYDRSESLRF